MRCEVCKTAGPQDGKTARRKLSRSYPGALARNKKIPDNSVTFKKKQRLFG